MKVRVRFAPSPTGHLHVGSVRTALFNWLLARHEEGTFVLRIEDTDQARSKTDYLTAVLDDLRWLGLMWDEGPFFQSKRLEVYHHHVNELLQKGLAYPCYCTPGELAQKRALAESQKKAPGYDGKCRSLSPAEKEAFEREGLSKVIRFHSPKEHTLTVHDAVRGKVDFSGELFEDFVILKSDQFPVYNFACAVDDHLMDITHVLRGEEHLSNTPRQLLIYEAFGWSPPVFGHLSIILDEQRKKLSKREGATYLGEFREAGFLPEALLNFLALLGWAPKENLELLPLNEIVRRFSLEGIGKSPAVFDFKKLEWMNAQYIKQLSPKALAEHLLPFLEKEGRLNPGVSKEWIEQLAELFHDRIKTLRQLITDSSYFFSDEIVRDPESLLVPETLMLVEEFIPFLKKTAFTPSELETALREFTGSKGVKAAELIHPLRLLLTGKKVSPGIFQVMALLGSDKTLTRLQKGVALFNVK